MEEMTENIFSSLKSKLANLKWRDEESRQSVVNKVKQIFNFLSVSSSTIKCKKKSKYLCLSRFGL